MREPAERELAWIDPSAASPLSAGLPSFPTEDAAVSVDRVVYCAVGARSLMVALRLRSDGHGRVYSLAGGISSWQDAGLPTQTAGALSASQAERYGRQIQLPGIGVAGQQRLLTSRVLVVGAGGLGSPVLLYLAAAGVGTLGIADDDDVSLSNLHRQVVHDTDAVGMGKVASAARRVRAVNPDVEVIAYTDRVDASTCGSVLDDEWDIIVDCTDNFSTRYLLNDAGIERGIPVVHGSIYRFDGQVTVFAPPIGPCYRCLFPTPPAATLAPNCAEAGVLGVLPGIVGSLQAAETIKLITGIGEPLVGRLMLYDALAPRTDIIQLARRAGCQSCSSML